MTISEEQLATYHEVTSEFIRQQRENTCLPVALTNVLEEFSRRNDIEGLDIDQEDVFEIVDYDPHIGSTSDYIPERLEPHLQQSQHTIQEERDISMEDLEQIIDDQSSSYPVVELDSRYLGWCDGYDIEGGMYGQAQPHTVVPFAFNHKTVLIFDPYESYYEPTPSARLPPHEIPQPLFSEWWSGESVPRWALWIEPAEQRRLDQMTSTDGE